MTDLIQRMAACPDCRTLALGYGTNLVRSRQWNTNPRDWGLPLAVTRGRLDDHLVSAHAEWLPERQPGCDACEAWSERYAIGPITEGEALHRTWHLCAELRDACTSGGRALTVLIDA